MTEVWGCIDDVLSRIFEDPPSPEAQVEVEFSYEGYRITVAQDTVATFVETGRGVDRRREATGRPFGS